MDSSLLGAIIHRVTVTVDKYLGLNLSPSGLLLLYCVANLHLKVGWFLYGEASSVYPIA